jgi:anthranilate phosphoribosyltransferase
VTRVTPDSAVARLAERRDLVEHEMAAVMESILTGGATPAQVAAILLGLREKGETVAELVGAARTLRAHGVRLPGAPPGAVDTCGTGGDGARTFNVSTAAALVVAAAGVPVAKHGNRAASSSAGSADVLEELGVVIELDPVVLARCLDEVGIAFLYAPAFHPALRRVAAVRRELGVRTLFNVLGPLVNPAGVRRQVVGVGDPLLLEPVARVLAELGAQHAWVVHGAGGLDELGLEGASDVMEVSARGTRRFRIHPSDAGLGPASHAPLRVGSVPESAACIRAVLAGEPGAARDVVRLNAAAVLVVAGAAADLREGAERAGAAIDSGAAARVLDRLVHFTRRARPAEASA